MSEQEQKAFKMYGKLPAKNHLTKMQKVSGPSVVSFPLPFFARERPLFRARAHLRNVGTLTRQNISCKNPATEAARSSVGKFRPLRRERPPPPTI